MKRLLLGALIAACLGVAAQAQTVTPGGGGCVAGSPCAASTMAVGGATIGANALAVTGSTAISGQIVSGLVALGSASYSFAGDLTTGWGYRSSGVLDAIIGGGEALRVSNTGVDALTGTMGASNGGKLGLGSGGVFDAFIVRGGAGIFQTGVSAASPVAYTLQGDPSRPGTDTNTAGANLTIASGNGTGSATGSSLILQAPVAVGSGTGAQTMTTGLTIKNGVAVMQGYTVSTLPASPGTGAIAYVTDATACTFMGALTGGASTFCPVVYNGSAWVGG